MADERRFSYRAVARDGVAVQDEILARNRAEAARRLSGDGLVVTELKEVADSGDLPLRARRRPIQTAEKVTLLRQLALMLRAGVDLLEALETSGLGMRAEIQAQLKEVAAGLRRGERFRDALQKAMPTFPAYVYALVELGQATGRLDKVFQDASQQMEFESRIQREIVTSLTYPSFLIVAGLAAVGFLFYEVVPRFATMVATNRESLDGFAALVLDLGEGFRANAVVVIASLVAIVLAASVFFQSPRGKAFLYELLRQTPVFSALLTARERATWARLMAFSIGNGLGLLEATNLGLSVAQSGRFRRGLEAAVRSLRKGKRVDESFGERGLLSLMDLSLLRAGQRSGALAEMFSFIAEQYEERFQQALKRVMALVEPAAIAVVAIAVGAVALGLVAAMSSVYQSVS